MAKFMLMKQNRWGTACIRSSNDKESLKKEKKKRHQAQSHRPYEFQLNYFIIDNEGKQVG